MQTNNGWMDNLKKKKKSEVDREGECNTTQPLKKKCNLAIYDNMDRP